MRQFFCLSLTIIILVSAGIPVRAEEQSAAPAATPDTDSQAADAPAEATNPANVPDLTGCWNGHWTSCVNGHKGPMNAQFCRRCDGHYDVKFNGRFWKLVPFHYKTTLCVTGYQDGKIYLSGSHYLGPILGNFSYNAWSDGCQFVSGYCARKDNGQFVMSK